MSTRFDRLGRIVPPAVSIILPRCGLLILIAVVSVIVYARVSPVAAQSAHDLDSCDGLPCYRGVTPGVTTWEQAMVVFNNRMVIQIDPPEWEIRLFQSATDDTVGRMIVRLASTDSLTLGKVVALFGDPCGVEYAAKARTALILYPRLVVKVAITGGRLTVATPVRQLWLRMEDTTALCAGLSEDSDALSVGLPWRGFEYLRIE